MCLDGGPDLVLRLLQVDVDPLRLDAVEVRVDEELDAVALGVPAAVLLNIHSLIIFRNLALGLLS